MKKYFLVLILLCVMGTALGADRYSCEYLKTERHFSIMNPFAEGLVENTIKSVLKKETGAKFKVKFRGYTFSSMKRGIFKYLELEGNNVVSSGIPLDYVHLKSLTDYNYIDYRKDPIEFKSDMVFAYQIRLTDESLNLALQNNSYQKVLGHINNIAYPMFEVKGVRTKIIDNKMYILTEYNFPIAPASKDKVFVASSDFRVEEGKIRAVNIKLDSAYGKISLNKVANLLNLLNPLEFTLQLLDTKRCDANVENVNIIDNKVQINGKINVKGD